MKLIASVLILITIGLLWISENPSEMIGRLGLMAVILIAILSMWVMIMGSWLLKLILIAVFLVSAYQATQSERLTQYSLDLYNYFKADFELIIHDIKEKTQPATIHISPEQH